MPGPPRYWQHGDSVENGWKIHSALMDWTGKVDTKASFALTIESAVLAGAIALSSKDKQLDHLNTGWELAWYRAGMALLVVSILFVARVVAPQLRSRGARERARGYYIFFGHLKFWEEPDIETALRRRDILPVLAHQLKVMSDIAWKKHRRLQLSMWLATFGSFFVAIAGWLNG